MNAARAVVSLPLRGLVELLKGSGTSSTIAITSGENFFLRWNTARVTLYNEPLELYEASG